MKKWIAIFLFAVGWLLLFSLLPRWAYLMHIFMALLALTLMARTPIGK